MSALHAILHDTWHTAIGLAFIACVAVTVVMLAALPGMLRGRREMRQEIGDDLPRWLNSGLAQLDDDLDDLDEELKRITGGEQ